MQPEVTQNGLTHTHTGVELLFKAADPHDTFSNMLLEVVSEDTHRKRNTGVIYSVWRLRWRAVEMRGSPVTSILSLWGEYRQLSSHFHTQHLT